MNRSPAKAIQLADYAPPDHRIERADLRIELDEADTLVHARLALRTLRAGVPLRLDGEGLEPLALRLDGRDLAQGDYRLEPGGLVIPEVPPEGFLLESTVRIHPGANTALEGLYLSGGNFCTQCEAEGFRRITWFVDRPDNLTLFTTRIEADQARYPILLSNGNPIEAGELPGGRHYALWHDPYPKPSYLYALVAGDLARVEDRFVTRSGRAVALRLYVQHGNEEKAGHAMASLKKAMRWDEERYGREYDLDIYMIVAVDDFNMGAMENKGLNIFNSRYVLARPETATDADYTAIEGVVAHEYFHNWSGNRVTCRDWFQLSLKEGFTVFRDQQFTEEMTAGPVARIREVGQLRSRQFREDGGPLAHPVRPSSYVEINNFYTTTVYNKGAEVVRMLHTLLGAERFRAGTDLYFARHDGQAATTEDFVRAMEEAGGVDLTQFRRWYEQAGTPELTVRGEYDAEGGRYTLHVAQRTPPTPGQPEKLPLHIPLAMGLLGADGTPLPLRLEGEAAAQGISRVVSVTEGSQKFTFVDIPEEPVPSLLRGFSAPVRLDFPYSDQALALLQAHDSDPFNRWEAGGRLALGVLRRNVEAAGQGLPMTLDAPLAAAFGKLLRDDRLDRSLVAEALTLPDEEYVAGLMERVDPDAIFAARRFLLRALAEAHRAAFIERYAANADPGPYAIDLASVGRRRLKNLALAYLMELGGPEIEAICLRQFDAAGNMTDTMAALTALAHTESPAGEEALARFYAKWRGDPLVLDKWFSIQATSPLPGTLERVQVLIAHPDFTLRNPNRVRSLIGAFCQGNPVRFHEAGGAGYAFLREQLLRLDPLNPQIAARMAAPLALWRRYDPSRQALMYAELERILAAPGLSRDLYEVASKSVATPV